MEISEARNLIQNAFPDQTKSTWIDLGCGDGTFTYALAGLLGKGSKIIAIDKSFQQLERSRDGCEIIFERTNFERLSLGSYRPDGILMANSLHYIEDQRTFIHELKHAFHKNGKIILVEYDTDVANRWVPYPMRFLRAKKLFQDAGFEDVQIIGERQSIYRTGKIYACSIM